MNYFKHSLSRKDLFRLGASPGVGSLLPRALPAREYQRSHVTVSNQNFEDETGSQSLSVEKLKQWESLGYGMFIHFGMSTCDGDEFSRGGQPAPVYSPGKDDRLSSDEELLGMYLVARSRGTNLLPDVPPDKNGVIPVASVRALQSCAKISTRCMCRALSKE